MVSTKSQLLGRETEVIRIRIPEECFLLHKKVADLGKGKGYYHHFHDDLVTNQT